MILLIIRNMVNMAKLILKKTGGAPANVSDLTASPSDVVENQIFYGAGSEKPQKGIVKKRGVVQQSIGANGSYIIRPGIYDAGGYINQSIEKKEGFVINPTSGGVNANVYGKYMLGNIIVNGVPNLSPENIRKGAFVGAVAGTFEGYINNSPLTPYWYGIFYPGQSGVLINNREAAYNTVSNASIEWQRGNAKPDGQYIHLSTRSISSGTSEYPAFRFTVPIEMQGVKSVTIGYSVPTHSANQYTWVVLAEKEVNTITDGENWNLSSGHLGAHESHALPATFNHDTASSPQFSERTFSLNNASRYKYIYVGLGVAASRTQGRFIDVKYIKLNT